MQSALSSPSSALQASSSGTLPATRSGVAPSSASDAFLARQLIYGLTFAAIVLGATGWFVSTGSSTPPAGTADPNAVPRRCYENVIAGGLGILAVALIVVVALLLLDRRGGRRD